MSSICVGERIIGVNKGYTFEVYFSLIVSAFTIFKDNFGKMSIESIDVSNSPDGIETLVERVQIRLE